MLLGRQPFAAKLPAESRIRARPGPSAGDGVHVVGALARRHHDAGVGRLQPAADRHPGLPPVVAAIETGSAREIDAAAHRARRQRARRHRAGRRSQPSPAVAVAAEERRAARDERAPAIDVERRREGGTGEDVGRFRHPVASAVPRSREADVRRQQQVMLVHRTHGEGQRAADEASGIDLQPRGAGIARAEQAAPGAGVVGGRGARRQRGRQHEDQEGKEFAEASLEYEGPGLTARAPRVDLCYGLIVCGGDRGDAGRGRRPGRRGRHVRRLARRQDQLGRA